MATNTNAPQDLPTTLVQCQVNGQQKSATVPIDTTLLTFLRDHLGLTGTKGACLEGECGSCTVLVDGTTVNSCLMLAAQANGRSITTIEGLADGEMLDSVQQGFIDAGAAQCGYCTPGLIISAKALLQENPDATHDELLTALEGNICRCTGYSAIVEAVKIAAAEMKQ